VTRFEIPALIIAETDRLLRSAGNDRLEIFVIWSGVVEGPTFRVRHAHVPRQHSGRAQAHVTIAGEALHELALVLEEEREVIGAQVHSHPEEAYHSGADDELAIATKRGAISVVVPWFGATGVMSDERAVYRLVDEGWVEVAPDLARALMVVT